MVFTLIPEASTFCKGYIRKGVAWVMYVDSDGKKRIVRIRLK